MDLSKAKIDMTQYRRNPVLTFAHEHQTAIGRLDGVALPEAFLRNLARNLFALDAGLVVHECDETGAITKCALVEVSFVLKL